MTNVKEQVDVKITNKVKDLRVVLNTATSGKASTITKKINGKICAIIINCLKPINIVIRFDEYKEIELLKLINFQGLKYIPLAITNLTSDHAQLSEVNLTESKFYVNNQLEIAIDGGKNTEAEIIIRYC